MLIEKTDRAWFSRLLQHPARKWSGSILTTSEPAQGCQTLNKLCGRPPQYAPTPCKLTVDLLTLKVVSESRVTWVTSAPILVFLGLSVLDLGPMYATDRQTSDVDHRLMSLPQRRRRNSCQFTNFFYHRQHYYDVQRLKTNRSRIIRLSSLLFSSLASNSIPQNQMLL